MKTFHLPDLGEGLQEAEIVNWHVGPGDQVVADQPLVSVETDKAVVEVPSPWGGRIAELFGGEGDSVKVGGPLVAFAEAASADTGTVVGEILRIVARKVWATAFSFFMFNGVFRNMKSISSVVTGAPCRAAAALPTMIASKRCSANTAAIRLSNGSAFMRGRSPG
jgi:pyruvate/2-oxoglutarate dehydrogenase complex dihydrolipoamide acyltransferase (E2) component